MAAELLLRRGGLGRDPIRRGARIEDRDRQGRVEGAIDPIGGIASCSLLGHGTSWSSPGFHRPQQTELGAGSAPGVCDRWFILDGMNHRAGALGLLIACGPSPPRPDESAASVPTPSATPIAPMDARVATSERPDDREEVALKWVPPAPASRPRKTCTAKPHVLPQDPATSTRGSPVGPGGGQSLYLRLFSEGACFRYQVSYRAQRYDGDTYVVASDQIQTGIVDCVVSRARRMAAVGVSEVKCVPRVKFELTGGLKFRGPDIAPARVYIATAEGLWWADAWPKTSAEIREVLANPQRVLFDATSPGTYDKDTSDEDVSFTTMSGLDAAGRWCWQQTERDDYALVERLCFARGGLVEARRVDVDEMREGGFDTYVYELLE